MKNRIKTLSVLALLLSAAAFGRSADADTLKCGGNVIKNGRAAFSVKTVSATRCPTGYELILNSSELARQVLSTVPALAGTAAGGALSGTYPNPDVGPGAIGPAQLSSFPGTRVALKNSAAIVPGVSGYNAVVPYDTVTYDPAHEQGATGQYLFVLQTGMYIVAATFSWSPSTIGYRELGINNHEGGFAIQQRIAPSPSQATVQTVATVTRYVKGDFVGLFARQDSGGPMSSLPDDKLEHASLTLQWIGP